MASKDKEFASLFFSPAGAGGFAKKAFDKSGLLIKLGKNFKSWKERAFGLDKARKTLSYFEDLNGLRKWEDGDPKRKDALLGEIPLTSAHLYMADFMPHRHCFEIVTPARNYFVYAKDESALSGWLWELHALGLKLKVPAVSGWLEKKGDWNSSLQRRFFRTELVAASGALGSSKPVKALLYYETFGEKAKGQVELDGAELAPAPNQFFTVKPQGKKRVYEFKAATDADLKMWLSELKHVIAGTKAAETEEKTFVSPEAAAALAAKNAAAPHAAATPAGANNAAAAAGLAAAGAASGASAIVFGLQLGATFAAAGAAKPEPNAALDKTKGAGAAAEVKSAPASAAVNAGASASGSAAAYNFDGDDPTAIVLDNGSGVIKIGLSGEDAPRLVFPTVIGRPKAGLGLAEEASAGAGAGAAAADGTRSRYVGEEANARAATLSLKSPIEHGVVTNWDDMELIWEYAFSGLQGAASPADRPVSVSEAVQNPRNNRELCAQLLFEKFGACGVAVSLAPLLALYAAGRTEGLVVDVGAGVTCALPVVDARPLIPSAVRTNVGGLDLTAYLMRLLSADPNANGAGLTFRTPADRVAINAVREKHCYVALQYDDELKRDGKALERTFDWSIPGADGAAATSKAVTLAGADRFRCAEALFQPSLIGSQYPGVHESAATVIRAADPVLQKTLWSNVVVSGGATLTDGFVERLRRELTALAPAGTSVNVVASDRSKRQLATWIGGSIVAGLPSFAAQCVTRREWDEVGPNVVHRKCVK